MLARRSSLSSENVTDVRGLQPVCFFACRFRKLPFWGTPTRGDAGRFSTSHQYTCRFVNYKHSHRPTRTALAAIPRLAAYRTSPPGLGARSILRARSTPHTPHSRRRQRTPQHNHQPADTPHAPPHGGRRQRPMLCNGKRRRMNLVGCCLQSPVRRHTRPPYGPGSRDYSKELCLRNRL